MTNDEYVAILKAKLEAGEMSDVTILQGADELKRRAEQRESVQGKSPRELLLLANAIRGMVIAHNAAQIAPSTQSDDPILAIYTNVPAQPQSLRAATEDRAARLEMGMGRLPADRYGWSDVEDEADYDERLEEEARQCLQERR